MMKMPKNLMFKQMESLLTGSRFRYRFSTDTCYRFHSADLTARHDGTMVVLAQNTSLSYFVTSTAFSSAALSLGGNFGFEFASQPHPP